MNILVLSDNSSILERAKPIFEKRKVSRWTFTNSDDINPKLDYFHITNNYDLVFSLHCKKIFPKVLIDAIRCINIHPGFNPYNRGIFPHVFSIINGLPAGVTIHEMTDEIDLGPWICQYQVEVKDNDTSGSLYSRIIDMEMWALDYWLDSLIANDYETFTEPTEGNYNSMADFKSLCNFDAFSENSFEKFFNLMRALSHPGYMNAHYNGIKFKLIVCEDINITHNEKH